MADRISLTGLRVRAYHGVFAKEKVQGQDFVIDITVWLDIPSETDDLAQTVNYAELAEVAVQIATGPARDLIETVAAEISDTVLARYRVWAVETTIHKPQAPIPHPFEDVAVTVRRSLRRTAHLAGDE